MISQLFSCACISLVFTASLLRAEAAAEPKLDTVFLTIDGVARQALVYAPAEAKTTPAPLVFVFHGHGGTSAGAVRSFRMPREWPQAISVHMQGLNTPGRLTDPEGKKPGWQSAPGMLGDRDLKFFDAMLAKVKTDYKVDDKRIFSTGHSNGGGFTYLLWGTRGDVFAAVAPSSAAAPGRVESEKLMQTFKPKPAMHLAGRNDPLVKFDWQQAAMEKVKTINGCATEGKPWAKDCTEYPSTTGTPFVAFIHNGTHAFPAEAPALIVKFFKEQGKK